MSDVDNSSRESEDFYPVGEASISRDILDLRPPAPKPQITSLYSDRPTINPNTAIAEFVETVGLKERYGHMKVVDDLVGLQRLVGGTIERYSDKLRNAESKSGATESARFGVGTFNGEQAVVFVVDWAFFAGSLGEVAGEKFVRAAELAEREQLPLISMGASSGVRQHENVLGLVQMQRMAAAASKFQHTTALPYISVLAGQVWGGMSASAVPSADLIVALEGTDYGFAGRRVIETFEGREVERGSQSAEANYLDRNIDVLAKDVPELVDWLGQLLAAVRHNTGKDSLVEVSAPTREPGAERTVDFLGQGFSAALWSRQEPEHVIALPRDRADRGAVDVRERLMANYTEIAAGAGRLDTEFLLRSVFDSAVPLFNSVQFEVEKRYPAVVGGLGVIDGQTFMVIGDQPSYRRLSDSYVRRQPASPRPEDFEYAVRMMQAAQRWRLPIVFFTDTLGALPTMAAERRGQSRAIAESIKTSASHPLPTVSVIIGAMGSGGGLATTPFGRHTVMLDSALGFVSEPRSTASILYAVANPTEDQVAMTLETIRASAADLKKQGLVDTIVVDEDDPFATADALRAAIVQGYEHQRGQSARRLRAQAAERLRPRTLGKLADEQHD